MNFPSELMYSKEHEWVIIKDNIATVGVTDFAQSELGDIVYVDIESIDEEINEGEVMGSLEAVKTVSDLFIPVSGTIIEVNEKLEDEPELVNSDPYGEGWLVKVKVDSTDLSHLLNAEGYKELIGK